MSKVVNINLSVDVGSASKKQEFALMMAFMATNANAHCMDKIHDQLMPVLESFGASHIDYYEDLKREIIEESKKSLKEQGVTVTEK